MKEYQIPGVAMVQIWLDLYYADPVLAQKSIMQTEKNMYECLCQRPRIHLGLVFRPKLGSKISN